MLISCRFEDGKFAPLSRFHNVVAAHFNPGQVYDLEHIEHRSIASHRHYFAQIRDAWLNLPEELALEYPSAEHLRKRMLIKAGYCEMTDVICSSPEEASRSAILVQKLDQYVMVEISGCVVRTYIAESQSMKAMGKQRFQASKDDVLSLLSELLDISLTEMKKQAGMAA
jgi:hypothetical protein